MADNTRDKRLKLRWEQIIELLTEKFSEGDEVDVEGVLYLIGLQE